MKNYLKIKRESKSYTQLDIAKLSNITDRQYRRIETRSQIPSVKTAMLIAKALDSTVEELFDDILLEQNSDNSSNNNLNQCKRS